MGTQTAKKKAAPIKKAATKPKGQAAIEEKVKITYLNDGKVIDIPLADIIPDPDQPRKFFDENELNDLAQSIVELGVIQPILVRKSGKKYMIVFGERRFRSSCIAKGLKKDITTIPCRVCELTDEQALELQITENLQRHDPHPMEEAASFEKYAVNHDLKEVALRVGRSPKFVAQRLLLTKMIPDFQEMFFLNRMRMEEALLLAKLSDDDQKSMLKERTKGKDWRKDKNFTIGNVQWFVNQAEHDLNKAPFKTEDATLYPEAGACGNCPFNSKNSLTLFIDAKAGRICRNSVCFQIKCDRHYANTLKHVMTDPSIVFITGYYSDYGKEKKAAEHKLKEVKDLGAVVLGKDDWRQIEVEQKYPTWEKYKKENDDWDEEYEDDTHDEYLKNLKEEWEGGKEEHEAQKASITKAKEEGRIKKAFVVVGSKEGKLFEIMIVDKAAEKLAAGGAADEVDGILKREARAKELDAEKVYEATRKLFVADENALFKIGTAMQLQEKRTLVMAVHECIRYQDREYFEEHLLKIKDDGKKHRYAAGDPLEVAKAIEALSEEDLEKAYNMSCRLLTAEKLFTMGGSHERSDTCYWAMQYAFFHKPNEVNDIQVKQQEIAKKRAARVEQRVNAAKRKNDDTPKKRSAKKATA